LAGSQVAILVSGYTMLMVSVNAYFPISFWLAEYDIYIRFPVFISIIALPIITAYILAWKYLVKSFYNSSVDQFWGQSKTPVERMLKDGFPEVKAYHVQQDHLRQDVGKMLKQLDRIEKVLEEKGK